ncbi:unnamed protein product [Agarophyton chilense]
MPTQSGSTSVLAMPRLPHTREPPSAPTSSGPPLDAVGYSGAWLTPPHPSCLTTLPRTHTPGFANLGNTCFLNAALQCLLHTPLTTLLLSATHHDNFTPHTTRFCVFCSLRTLARQLHSTPTPRVVAPSAFANNARLVCAAFRHGRQEDAHEFVRALLDGMTRAQVFGCAFGRAGGAAVAWQREMNADVHRLFGGVLQSCVHCTECDHKSITTEPFLDLSLEISRVSSVERALDRFCALETLKGDNRYRCEGCRSLVDAHKRFSVRRAPNVLTLHLKRFDRTRKDSRFISFPETLDLAPYMYGRPRDATAKYRLSALLIHQGTSRQFGHYFAFVRSANGSWCLKDDSTSKAADLSTVMRQKAYLLFYTRIEDAGRQQGKNSPRAPFSAPRKKAVSTASPPTREAGNQKEYAAEVPRYTSKLASRASQNSRTGNTPESPAPSQSLKKEVPQPNGMQVPTVKGDLETKEIELSEESSDEDEVVRRKRSKSQTTNKTQSSQSSESTDDRSSKKSDGSKYTRASVAENAKRIMRSPVKALASLTGSRRLSDDKMGKQEESSMRRLLGPGRRRSESTVKSNTREHVTPGEAKVERRMKSSSLVEPVTKAFSSRKMSVLSLKRHEDRPKKARAHQEGPQKKAADSPSQSPLQTKTSLQTRFDRRVATTVEGIPGRRKLTSDVKEPKRFFSTLRRESKLAARQEAKASSGSDDDTIPSDPVSSAEDDESHIADHSSARAKESQSPLPSTPRRTSSQEVLIAGGFSVQQVMRRVFGLSPLTSRSERKKASVGSQSTGQSRQQTDGQSMQQTDGQSMQKTDGQSMQKTDGQRGSPKSDASKCSETPSAKLETRSKLQFRTTAPAKPPERPHMSSPRLRLGSSSIFSAEGVDTWETEGPAVEQKQEDSTRSFSRSKIVKRRRAHDSLDAEYDRGKQKKARQKFNPVTNGKGRNVFDAFIEKKR